MMMEMYFHRRDRYSLNWKGSLMTLTRPTTLSVLLLVCFVASPSAAQDKKAKAKKAKMASIVLKGALPESVTPPGLFGELEQNLKKTIDRINKVAKDENVKGLVLDIEGVSAGRGKVAELREAIANVRKSGKKVYAKMNSGMGAQYLIASACDEIIMPPPGMLVVAGMRAEVSHYKGLLDKLGIKADFLHMGRFKGAAEPVMRTEMSPEVRKQYELVIGDLYDSMVDQIAADRKIEPAKVKALIDQGLFTAEAAKTAGLIDRVAYDDQFQAALKKTLGVEDMAMVKKYGKKKVDTDFSGFGGMVKLMQAVMGVEASGPSAPNKIAVIYAVGAIVDGPSTQSMFGGSGNVGSTTMVKALRKAAADKKVKAIVLRVNSPGGSALASDLIWREIELIKKPIIASMGDVAASGGYYISMGCDKILVEGGTITGSIGVVGGKMTMGGLFEKIGVTTQVISRGKNSGWMSINTPFSDSERKAVRATMEAIYKQFTSKAAEGRKMKLDKLESLAEGRIWTGRQAVENGLADKIGTLADAIKLAKGQAGLKEGDKVDLMILPKPKSFFEQLFDTEGESSASSSIVAAAVRRETGLVGHELAEAIDHATTLTDIFRQPTALVMPYHLKIK
jgi:protease-4